MAFWLSSLKGRRATYHQDRVMACHQQLLCHIIFSAMQRTQTLRGDELREEVWESMAGICSRSDGDAPGVGGSRDHAHWLVRIPAKIAISDFVRPWKANTSKLINEHCGTGAASNSSFHFTPQRLAVNSPGGAAALRRWRKPPDVLIDRFSDRNVGELRSLTFRWEVFGWVRFRVLSPPAGCYRLFGAIHRQSLRGEPETGL